jgi:hypothetical protein
MAMEEMMLGSLELLELAMELPRELAMELPRELAMELPLELAIELPLEIMLAEWAMAMPMAMPAMDDPPEELMDRSPKEHLDDESKWARGSKSL